MSSFEGLSEMVGLIIVILTPTRIPRYIYGVKVSRGTGFCKWHSELSKLISQKCPSVTIAVKTWCTRQYHSHFFYCTDRGVCVIRTSLDSNSVIFKIILVFFSAWEIVCVYPTRRPLSHVKMLFNVWIHLN